MPLAKLEWANETALLPNDEADILTLYRNLQDDEVPAIPAMQPLAVGNQLFMRTARIMLGVDLRTGLRVWPYPEEELERGNDQNQTTSLLQERQASEQNHMLLTQRIWQDSPYAQMSSDGQRLFLLRDLSAANSLFASPEIMMFGRQGRIPHGLELPKDYNRLVALELATEGKTLWTVGGPDSHDPGLTSVFFLGVPLPLDGHLFVLAEIKDEIKLVSLDAATGRMEWSQQLALVEALTRCIPIRFAGWRVRALRSPRACWCVLPRRARSWLSNWHPGLCYGDTATSVMGHPNRNWTAGPCSAHSMACRVWMPPAITGATPSP